METRSNAEKKRVEKYLKKECDKKIEEYAKQIDEAIRLYLAFGTVRTRELSVAFGELDFILPFSSKRNLIYTNLYRKQTEQIKAIQEINFHFNLYVEGRDGSKAVMLHYIWELQDMLISEIEGVFYKKYMFDVDTQMAKTLEYAHGKKNRDEPPNIEEYVIAIRPEYMERMKPDASEQ